MKLLLRSLLLVLLLSATSLAQESFVKLQRDKTGKAQALQTAISRLKLPSGQTVDLVAVVHVADKAYYGKVNKHLGGYQTVLYEMVLDIPQSAAHQNRMRQLIGKSKKQPKIDTSKGGNDPVSLFQRKLAELLGLEFQLPLIDYNRDNFVHADLTLKEFEKAMAAKKQSASSLLKTFLDGAGKKPDTPEEKAMAKLSMLKILSLGPTPQEQKILKAGLAADFSDLSDSMAEMEGTALLSTRNQRVMDILKERLAQGDKQFAIFYGAAHMPDLRERLKKQGWKPVSIDWLSAWKL